MLNPLVIPSRNFFEFFLCAIGAYAMTKVAFPPNDPPPEFPFIAWFDRKDRNE